MAYATPNAPCMMMMPWGKGFSHGIANTSGITAGKGHPKLIYDWPIKKPKNTSGQMRLRYVSTIYI